jgi:hypothetical protein
MQALTAQGVRSLASTHRPPCLSLYLPTHSGRVPDDQAKLEGLARRARKLLHEKASKAEIDALLAPLDALRSPEAWNQQLAGLAVFLSSDFHTHFRLPVEVPELLVVADSFHLRPLLRYVEANQQYFVLLLSQNHVGFLRGSAEGLVSVPIEGFPHSMTEALGKEDRERSVNYHFGGKGGSNPIYGGGGKADSSRDEDLARFCRSIDQSLWSVLRDEKAPLLVAAPVREAALFRSLTRYPHVAGEFLGADLGKATVPEIHARAWPVVQKLVAGHEGELLERYNRLVSSARSIDEVRGIAKFAFQGRVRDLLLERGANLWGRLDRDTGDVALFGARQDERQEDVLDDIAEAVILRGGDVWSLDKSRMPTKSPIAATLRW